MDRKTAFGYFPTGCGWIHPALPFKKPLSFHHQPQALFPTVVLLSVIEELPLECPVLPKGHFLRKPHPLPHDASEEQIERLFAVIHDPRDKAMFALMLECGLRVGEVCALSLEDLFLENHPPRLKVHGKGDRHRIAYLPPPALSTLKDWLTRRPITNDRAVFISQRDRRLSVNGVQFILQSYCEKAEIYVTCHQFRHAFGRHMAEASMPLTSLQHLLGHRSPRTSQGYAHLSDPALKTEYDRAIQQMQGCLA